MDANTTLSAQVRAVLKQLSDLLDHNAEWNYGSVFTDHDLPFARFIDSRPERAVVNFRGWFDAHLSYAANIGPTYAVAVDVQAGLRYELHRTDDGNWSVTACRPADASDFGTGTLDETDKWMIAERVS